MTQHSGPVGPEEDDDYGPPDWFAAVAAPGSESRAEPKTRPEAAWQPQWEPEPAPARARAVKRPAARPAEAGELGLVQASELPTGRRRRRSALEAESGAAVEGGAVVEGSAVVEGGRGGGAGSDGHGGAADLAPAFPDERPRRRSGRTRGAGASGGRDHDGTERAPGRRGAGRGARTEEPADPESLARDICLRLLTGTAKSRKQLADALRKREIPDEVAEEVLARLEEVGLIDDAAFARAWVESRHSVRGLSRRALAQELRTKGISGELAEQALAQVDHDDEAEAARALVDRRLRATRGLERQTRTRRLVGLLARRGYSEGLAFRVVRDALDAEGATDEDEYGDEGDDYRD